MKSRVKTIILKWCPPAIIQARVKVKTWWSFQKVSSLLKSNAIIKNSCKGRRCFILGSGKSILAQDLTLLENDAVFALNNFLEHPQFGALSSHNVDRFYLVAPIHGPQKSEEWENWLGKIDSRLSSKWKLWVGLSSYVDNAYRLHRKKQIFNRSEIFWYFAGREVRDFEQCKIDFSEQIYLGSAASVYALQLALFMGFEDIYLLGMDHDYLLYLSEREMRFYETSEHQENELERTFGKDFYIEEFARQHSIFRAYRQISDSYPNARIWNGSPKGLLQIFPRVNYKSLF